MWLIGLWLVAGVLEKVQAQGCQYLQYVKPGLTHDILTKSYSAGYQCSWTAYTDSTAQIYLSCRNIDIPRSGNGCLDVLRITTAKESKGFCGADPLLTYESGESRLTLSITASSWSPGGRFDCQVSSRPKNSGSQNPKLLSQNCDCGWSYSPRIVGGQETKVNEFPMMAGLVASSRRYIFCGATILTPNYVLTAAHCVERMTVPELAIVVGEHNVKRGDETDSTKIYLVSTILQHPQYNNVSNANDVALVRSQTPITYSMKVGPVCLPFRYSQDFVGQTVTALGWGTTSFGGPLSDYLQKAFLKVVPISSCNSVYPMRRSSDDAELCTYADGTDACQADSGGPLLWLEGNSNRYLQLGITSTGAGCASGYPGLNMRVFAYLNWILDNTQADTFCLK